MKWVTTTTILHDLRDYANRDAWDHFVGRFREPLRRFAASQGIPGAQAEDVAQETLAAFAESLRLGRYERDRGRLSSWLFGIAYKQVLKERTRQTRRERPIGGADELESARHLSQHEQDAADHWKRAWDGFVARVCMEQIRREFRGESVRAFELLVREERTPAETAETLGVTVKAVYNAKHRILKRMRELRAELEEMA